MSLDASYPIAWDPVQNLTRIAMEELLEQTHIFDEIRHYLPLVEQVISQARRRVMDGESVPASEKLVSIFEPHTDIIIKDRRDTHFGQLAHAGQGGYCEITCTRNIITVPFMHCASQDTCVIITTGIDK